MAVHVVPVGDIREHVLDEDCWCDPFVDQSEDEDLVVHNSLDKRELYENGELKPH